MLKNIQNIPLWGVCLLLFLLGALLVYYGFDLVSVPGVREHRESIYILFGLMLCGAGAGIGFMIRRS